MLGYAVNGSNNRRMEPMKRRGEKEEESSYQVTITSRNDLLKKLTQRTVVRACRLLERIRLKFLTYCKFLPNPRGPSDSTCRRSRALFHSILREQASARSSQNNRDDITGMTMTMTIQCHLGITVPVVLTLKIGRSSEQPQEFGLLQQTQDTPSTQHESPPKSHPAMVTTVDFKSHPALRSALYPLIHQYHYYSADDSSAKKLISKNDIPLKLGTLQ